jgi:integrase
MKNPKPRSRTYGLGRIYRKNDKAGAPYGSWYIAYSVRGAVHKENAHTRDEQEAIRLLKKRLGEASNGTPIGRAIDRTTIADLFTALDNHYALEDAPNRRNLPAVRAAWFKALGADRRAADVTTDALAAVAIRWRRDRADASVNRRMEMLRRAFRLGASVTPPTVARVPSFPAKIPEDNVREGFTSPETFWLVHEALASRDPVLQDFVEWLFWTGMRVGAVRDLEWTAIDRERWAMSLVRRRRKNKGKPKWLPLAGPLRALLERAWARRVAHAAATGRLVPWVFWRVYDGHPRPGLVAGDATKIVDFRKAWTSACAEAGCPGLTPHDLRRTAAKELRKDADEATCMQIMAQETPSIFRRYNIVEEAELGAALEAVFTRNARQARPRLRRRRLTAKA